MSTTPPPPSLAPAAAPSPAPAPAAPAKLGPTGKPVDSPHLCVICGERIRKNNQSYRGFIPVEMIAAIRREKPSFHVRQDICLACGKKFFDAVSAKAKKPAWMLRPLG